MLILRTGGTHKHTGKQPPPPACAGHSKISRTILAHLAPPEFAFVCTNFISHGDFALWLDLFLLPDFFIKIRVPGADYVWCLRLHKFY